VISCCVVKIDIACRLTPLRDSLWTHF